MKKGVIAVVAVFVAWLVLEFLIHEVLLRSSYEATANLWRPPEEMKMGLMMFVGLISAAVFVSIYALFFAEKGIATGLKYGVLSGIGGGIGMAYGSYAVLPIPYHMALTWFLGALVEMILAGLLVGWIIQDTGSQEETLSSGE